MPVDLHMHSKCSDGMLGSAELVKSAHHAGVSILALTDHDTVQGVQRAIETGNTLGVQVIPGIELSTVYTPDEEVRKKYGLEEKAYPLHILGYGINHESKGLLRVLEQLRAIRETRLTTICTNINKTLEEKLIDVENALEWVKENCEGPPTRPDLAQYLVEKRFVSTTQEAFDKWLVQHNVPVQSISSAETFALIHALGGIAVLAHPGEEYYSVRKMCANPDAQKEILLKLFAQGLNGVEVYTKKHSPAYIGFLEEICKQNNWRATGGSDLHKPAPFGTDTFTSFPDEIVLGDVQNFSRGVLDKIYDKRRLYTDIPQGVHVYYATIPQGTLPSDSLYDENGKSIPGRMRAAREYINTALLSTTAEHISVPHYELSQSASDGENLARELCTRIPEARARIMPVTVKNGKLFFWRVINVPDLSYFLLPLQELSEHCRIAMDFPHLVHAARMWEYELKGRVE